MLPNLNKTTIPSFSAALICFLIWKNIPKQERPTLRKDPIIYKVIIFLIATSPILTALNNTDPIISGPRYIPGLNLYDAGSMSLALVTTLIPFFLAKRFLATPESHLLLLKSLCIAGVVYSFPIIFEARMSPQLHTWFYGYFPYATQFIQHMRPGGGFRPLVFFEHGLLLGIFIAITVISSISVWREKAGEEGSFLWLLSSFWLLVTLVIGKSLGPLVLTILFIPIVLFTKPKFQILISTVIAAIVLIYPLLRDINLIPTETIYNYALKISEVRADSLQFRLSNEDILLERARERPITGWGSWGRPEVRDAITGRTISVWDGVWIITISTYGWLGYIAQFGLLTLPIFMLVKNNGAQEYSSPTAGLAIILSLNLIDLIPNASATPLLYLVCGALYGRCLYISKVEPKIVLEENFTPTRFVRRTRS